MEKAYKFRLYPNKAQEELIQKTFGCSRFVFNHFLAERMEQYKQTGKAPTRFQQDKSLTVLKQELEWLREPDSHALQKALKDLDDAYTNFFRRVKQGGKPGFPKFKKKRSGRRSYRTSGTIKVLDKAVQLPKLGTVKCRVSKEVKGRILSATVSQNPSGECFVSLCCTDVEIEPLPKNESAVGIDLGLKAFVTTSDGMKYPNHKHLAKSLKKLAKLQRELSRKQKGSKRWEKARIQVARLHEHVANQRQDALHKLSTGLIRRYGTICIEDLSPSQMLQENQREEWPKIRTRNQNRALLDASWAEFRRQLEYKGKWYGREVIAVDRDFPSTQICSSCGAMWSGTKDTNVRKWTCSSCGAVHDRNLNAAINILNEGLCLLA